jgi:hypothetical protein
MNILGVSCYYHDAAAALLQNGQLIAAAEEERFSRIKHDSNFPRNAIQFCLDTAKIKGCDLDYVVFFEKPFRKLDRILSSVLQTYPRSWKVFRESMIGWVLDKLWVAGTIQAELKIERDRVLFSEHHLSHAASAFLCSPFEEAAILTVDGVGEWATTACGTGRGNQIRLTREVEFPHSLGLLYSTFTAFLGFEVNEGEYKVMGMAGYGTPRYAEKVWKVVRQNRDGSFALDMDYFCFHHSADRLFDGRFTELFGRARPRNMPFFTGASGYPKYFCDPPANFAEMCRVNQHYADVAASVQKVTEELLLGLAGNLQKETGLEVVHRWWGGVKQRGQQPDSAGDRLRRDFHSTRGGGFRRRAGSGVVGVSLAAGAAANVSHGARVLGPGTLRVRNRGFSETRKDCAPARQGHGRIAGRGGEAIKPGESGGVVPGTSGVGAAGIRKPQHSGGPAESRHEGYRQYENQISRALPAVRAFGARGTRGRVLRPAANRGALSGALHALRGADAGRSMREAAGGDPRGWDGAGANRFSGAQRAFLRLN